jgi:hypothetical protein
MMNTVEQTHDRANVTIARVPEPWRCPTCGRNMQRAAQREACASLGHFQAVHTTLESIPRPADRHDMVLSHVERAGGPWWRYTAHKELRPNHSRRESRDSGSASRGR